MIDISNIPDLKLFLLYDETKAFTGLSAFVYRVPKNKLILARKLKMFTDAIGVNRFDKVKFDEIDVGAESDFTNSGTRWLDLNHDFNNVPSSLTGENMIPVRDNFSVTVSHTNLGSCRVQLWAYVHDDPDKEYQDFATISGGK